MFRAIGIVIILWGFSSLFGSAFAALNDAVTATFRTIEMTATVTQSYIENL